jgi:hypothetical protein
MSGSAPVPMNVPADVGLDDLRRDLAGAPSVAPALGSRSDYSCSSAAASADEVQAAASAADGRDDFALAAPLIRRQQLRLRRRNQSLPALTIRVGIFSSYPLTSDGLNRPCHPRCLLAAAAPSTAQNLPAYRDLPSQKCPASSVRPLHQEEYQV